MSARKLPNIIITGTPGVGKTSHCELMISQNPDLKHIAINHIVKDRNLHEGFDKDLKSFIVDEDKLLDSLEEELIRGGNIIDWHACDLFPESWIDLVIVLRTETATLYDRLKARNYSEIKLQDNMDSEIMEVLLSEAREAYDAKIVVELQSNDSDDVESNVDRIGTWISHWKQNKKPVLE